MIDAIVVGAGPAGATTALRLARLGHDVVLLDRRAFPRAKPCGDCLSPAATAIIRELGLLAEVEACRPARLIGWRLFSPGGEGFSCRFDEAVSANGRPPTAFAIPRHHFDAVLVDAASRAGAQVRTGVHVTGVTTDSGGSITGVSGRTNGRSIQLRGRLVIGADGLRSVVARRLGLLRRRPRLRKVSLTAHLYGVRGLDDWGEMHVSELACAGLAPVGDPAGATNAPDRTINVTLVASAAHVGRTLRRDPRAFFRTQLERLPRLSGRIPEVALANPSLLASGPFDWPTRAVVADRVALVGDAAGYYDPFTGEGIYHALLGARLLADEADSALRADDLSPGRLHGYARRLRRATREGRLLQHLIEFVIAHPSRADAAFRRLAAAPATARALTAATGNLGPARAVLAPRSLLDFLAPPDSAQEDTR